MDRHDSRLFIGGPADGARYAVQYGDVVKIPARAALPGQHESDPHQAPAGDTIYRRVWIAGERQAFGLWVAAGVSTDEALLRILSGYGAGEGHG